MPIPPFGAAPTPDATSSKKGKVQLTGALGGTAASPTTPTAVHITGSETITGDKIFTITSGSATPITAVVDSSSASQPAAILKDNTNFAQAGNILKIQMVNATDSGDAVRIENAGTGKSIIASDGSTTQWSIDKNGNAFLGASTGLTYQSQSASVGKFVLPASTKLMIEDHLEIGSTATLEIPSTSSLDIVPVTPLAITLGLVNRLGNFVEYGCIITNPSAALVTVSSGVVWINGQRIAVATFGPTSQGNNLDGYYDVDTTGTVQFTSVGNNVASPGLNPNRVRLGIVVTGGGTVSVINQGNPATTGPTVSSNILSVTDTLGNLIYPASPGQTLIGYRQITSDFSVASASYSAATGLSVPFILGSATQRISVTVWTKSLVTSGTTATAAFMGVFDGSTAGTQLSETQTTNTSTTADEQTATNMVYLAPGVIGLKTYIAAVKTAAGTVFVRAAATYPTFIAINKV